MTTPGMNPPPDGRSGRIGALRDNYSHKVKSLKAPRGERQPWWKLGRRAK